MRSLLLLMLVGLNTSYIFGQAVNPPPVNFYSAHLWIAMIGGVFIAIGVVLLLTNLAVASGLSLINVRSSSHSHSQSGNPLKKITTGFGAFTVITTSGALFFAVWLVTELSGTPYAITGITLGLMIWGIFFIVMVSFEFNAVSSLIGSILHIAKTGVISTYHGLSSMFGKSDESKAEDMAGKVTEQVINEFEENVDIKDLKGQIQKYVDQLEPQRIDIGKLRSQIEKILNEIDLEAIQESKDHFSEKEVSASLELHSFLSGKDVKKVTSTLNSIIDNYKSEKNKDKDNVSKTADTIMRTAGVSEEDAENYRIKFEDLLRSTNKSELEPEQLKRDIEKLFTDPETGKEAIMNRFSKIDRDFITDVISAETDLSKEQVESRIDRVYDTVENIKNKLMGKADNLRESTDGTKGKAREIKNTMLNRVRAYLNSLDRPELNYEGVKGDLKELFISPKQGFRDVANRLKQMDRDTIKAIIASKKNMDEEDAERLLNKIESMRDQAINKYEKIAQEIEIRIQKLKEEALHQAEEAKEITAAAAWWSFATAIVSGAACVIAGFLGSGF